MKKLVLLCAVCLVGMASANAQRLTLGGKLGANLTKIDGVKFSDSYQLNYHLGAFAEIDFNKSWGIQPELFFSQSSSTVESDFGSVYEDVPSSLLQKDVKLNYMSIPVLLRVNAGSFLTFHAGPQFSILINDDENLLNNGKNAFKDGDLSAVLGAQVNVSKLRVYGRYNIGLANINDIDNSNKWRSQQIQVGVGFTIL